MRTTLFKLPALIGNQCRLDRAWLDHAGTGRVVFWLALLIALAAVPVAAWQETTRGVLSVLGNSLTFEHRLILKTVNLAVFMGYVYTVAALCGRTAFFTLGFAGLVYITCVVGALFAGLESLSGPLRAVLQGQLYEGVRFALALVSLVWIAFVFKTAFVVRASVSVVLAVGLLCAILVTEMITEAEVLHYLREPAQDAR
jgi:hypothetical protein